MKETAASETRMVELGIWKVVLLNDMHWDYKRQWNNLLMIEAGFISGTMDSLAILSAVAIRLCCIVLAVLLSWARYASRHSYFDGIHPALRTRVMTHFELHLMQACLHMDVPTSEDSHHGKRSLWDQAHVVYTDNKYFQRMKSLVHMASDAYRSEVLGSDLVYLAGVFLPVVHETDHSLRLEYQKATSSLGHVSDEWAEEQYSQCTNPWMRITGAIMGDVPMMYYSVAATMMPSKFSISSITILHQSSRSLEWSMWDILRKVTKFQNQCEQLRMLYDADKIHNHLVDGCLSYSESLEKSQGMSFKLRNLSFSCPGSQSTKPALSNVNLTIQAGQLVVIVGANGSGKSTIIKLLACLYDPTLGPDSLIVDGIPISKYRMSELQEVTAMLMQDHLLFPVSLGKNIGLGWVQHVGDLAMIDYAAELRGATHCLTKLTEGKDMMLAATNEPHGYDIPENDAHPLQVEVKKLLDKPSSALDPEGEALLFGNLIDERDGKTMIFVTHWFGHLAKHADLIVCMKDGNIVETGNHKELVEMNGEYAKLYNMQASAFV
ncbi:P-loop containing nucleoside triphosphate hydrolase protein [Armillaria luteobubalina]|uniref:P-loop containing nucleoside triphosphate hydrolase protein n=1 Tax=Armillaria luteobubalina TaxID=153913 RepID=A0AA39UTY8_9AGAR|nr:P-loop containing nucleoside triphosphate hydrolase protein [Armillaria luteobubalina]